MSNVQGKSSPSVMGNLYTEMFGLEGTPEMTGSAFGPVWSALVRRASGALLAAPLCPSWAGKGRLGVYRKFWAFCLPGGMVGAAEGHIEAPPEPALSPAGGSPVGGRSLVEVWVMRVSLQASGKIMYARERRAMYDGVL